VSEWIHIPRWDQFQHYKKRDPPWIKDYRSQLDNPTYLGLTFAQRGLLHDLRLLYLVTHKNVTLDTRKLSRRLGERVLSIQLEALNDAGLIEVRASTPLDQSREEKNEDALQQLRELQRILWEK
jgi:hypothetical protein